MLSWTMEDKSRKADWGYRLIMAACTAVTIYMVNSMLSTVGDLAGLPGQVRTINEKLNKQADGFEGLKAQFDDMNKKMPEFATGKALGDLQQDMRRADDRIETRVERIEDAVFGNVRTRP